jgi:hypothetical protein
MAKYLRVHERDGSDLLIWTRFETFADLGNPMKGINLFPFLKRSVEGRALHAVGPERLVEMCRVVAEDVEPPRWPIEVLVVFGACSSLCLFFHWIRFVIHGTSSHASVVDCIHL